MRRLTGCAALALILVAGVAAAGDPAPPTGSAVAGWPQFGGPNRDGLATDGKLADTWPEGGPKEVWKIKVGPGYGGAAIEGGKVYLLDRVADKTEVLRCIDLVKGTEDWTVEYDAPGKLSHNGSRSTPSVDDKFIFTIGAFGHLTCVSKADHKQVWAKNILTDFEGKLPQWGVAQSPLVYKDLLIAAPQTAKVGVVAYDKATGAVKWQSEPIGLMTDYNSPLACKVAGEDQIIMYGQVDKKKTVNVVGLDPASGKILWTYSGWSCGIPIPAPTACGDDRFFLTGGYNAGCAMFKVEKKDGKFTTTELFNKNAEISSHNANPIFYKGFIYANGSSVQEPKIGLVCMDPEGKVKWKTGPDKVFDLGNILIVDDKLFVMGGANGVLSMVQASPDGFKVLASAKVLGSAREIWACMAFSDGKLVCRDGSTMKCLDLRK